MLRISSPRSSIRRLGLVLAAAILPAVAAVSLGQTAPRPGSYREEARVERVVVDAHVIDSRGEVIPDLAPGDFRVTVDGQVVPLESADWVPAGVPEVPETSTGDGMLSEAAVATAAEAAPGRLLIFLFQTDYNTSRLTGLVRMGLQAERFLGTLLPSDRVAVLSFDSHLKLRQDFTADREKILAGIHAAIRTGKERFEVPGAGPSLARHFDYAGAARAITPERALALISNAAEPIPGGKSLLFFAWGLNTIGGMSGPNPRDVKDFRAAVPALAKARITIFSLDVTNADYHSLEGTLSNISDMTGGTYQKTHIFPGLAMDRVRRAIAGRYVLVFVKPAGRPGYHDVHVALAGRKGRVLARGYYEDATPASPRKSS